MASVLKLNLAKKNAVTLLTRSLSTEVTHYKDNLPSKRGEDDEPVTHTGQKFAPEDFRRARFMNARKEVNTKFAIELIKKQPIIVCDHNIAWSGGPGLLGHPITYINLDSDTVHVCVYSGRRFIQKKIYDPVKHGECISFEEYSKELLKEQQEMF